MHIVAHTAIKYNYKSFTSFFFKNKNKILIYKMNLPLLPDECLSNVFSFLDEISLYKCLFVNRYYCKLSIPIIWREPFRFTLLRNSSLLINTLLACLDEGEISSLIPCEINFNHNS